MRTLRGLDLGVILYDKTSFIVTCFYSYNFYRGPIRYPIGLQKFLIQYWYNTPVYIALVYKLKLLLEVSDYLLENQYMMVPLDM